MEQLYILALLLWLSCDSNCCIVQLEAEQGNSNGAQMYRGSASNGLTILLHRGESIEHTIRASSFCGVTVSNVAYSNDGISDFIALSRDAIALGNFRTVAETGNGDLWNTFKNSGPVGNPYEIYSGTHKLTLKVILADRYGVEIDRTTLSIVCAGIETGPEKECPKSAVDVTGNAVEATDTNENGGLSTWGIVGIDLGAVFTFASVVIGVPGCILACKRLYT